jgi:hypothetical protein
MRKDAPLAVNVPAPDRDSPGWAKVGVIAAIGFVIGIAWPRVVGVRLGPSAPGEAAAAAAASASAAGAAKAGQASDAPPASVNAKAAPATGPSSVGAPAPSAAPPPGPPQVLVQRGSVIACKTTDGESKRSKECGSLTGLDSVVPPHLRKLATCSAAEGQTGKLSFVATASFPSGGLSWDVGKSSTVGNLEGITNCLKTHFSGVTASGVAHEHKRYTVAYSVTFAPSVARATPSKVEKVDPSDKSAKADSEADDDKDDKSESVAAPVAAAAGEASVGWEVALVRDVPKTGSVIARLPRGTKVKIGASKDGWYAIKFGEGFASEGFVYRGALGR